MNPPRVAVLHQGFIPHYRLRFFELLSQCSETEYVVFHGQPPSAVGHFAASGPFAFPNVALATRELRFGRRTLVVHAPGPVLHGRFDGLVIGTHLLFATNHFLFAWFKAHRHPVLLWGHGREQAEPRLKRQIARLADGYLAYTSGGAAWLAANGVDKRRIAVVRNTLDMDSQIALHSTLERTDEAALRGSLGLRPDSAVLVYVGRVYGEKRVPELLEALHLLRTSSLVDRPVEIAIIGDGPGLPEVRDAANGLDGVHILGQIYDQEVVAQYLRVATAMVIPGAVGLSVNHSLAHATPVITRAEAPHGPEIEFLNHGENGLIVGGGLSEFSHAIASLIRCPRRRRTLEAGARTTREQLGLDQMVDAFDQAVRTVLQRTGR